MLNCVLLTINAGVFLSVHILIVDRMIDGRNLLSLEYTFASTIPLYQRGYPNLFPLVDILRAFRQVTPVNQFVFSL